MHLRAYIFGGGLSQPKGSDGLRTKKIVNGTTTEYTYASGLLVSQSDPTTTLNFTYSADGIPRTVTYGQAQYYYLYNLQGDVIGIYNSQGSQVVSYTYDTWGKLVSVSGSLASTLGAKNPFRYRGYVYDTETGYYYLTTRYYDPETGRFLNADGYVSTGEPLTGYNMFAYCYDNPVMYEDSGGSRPIVGDWPRETKEERTASVQNRWSTYNINTTSSVYERIEANASHTVFVYKQGAKIPDTAINRIGESFSVVIDKRATDNFQIVNSCLIEDHDLQFDISSTIREYHDLNPTTTQWDREVEPMTGEWYWHNKFYSVSSFFGWDEMAGRFASVDLDYYYGCNDGIGTQIGVTGVRFIRSRSKFLR